MSNSPENQNTLDARTRMYWEDLLEIERVLNSNSMSDIAQVCYKLNQSKDKVRQRLGNCLSEVGRRPDWGQAKIDAYRAARGEFDEWKRENGE